MRMGTSIPENARPTRGARLLNDWLKAERRTQLWLAEQIGTHQTSVSAWIRGRTIPLDMALAVRNVTGIEVEDWAIVEAPASGSAMAAADESTGTDD